MQRIFITGFLLLMLSAQGLAWFVVQERETKRVDKAPKVGVEAPDFVLEVLGAENKEDKPAPVRLTDFRDKSSVVLILGSYT